MRRDSVGVLESLPIPPGDEQDEPLAWQEHGLTIDNLHYPLYGRLRGPACFVAEEVRLYRDAEARRVQDYVAPDLLVALGIADRVRERYIIAEEGKAPDLVVEVLSESSADNGDLTRKRDTYRTLGVREYVVVDPLGRFASEPRLQAWRFRDARGVPLPAPASDLPDADGVLRSAVIPFGWTVRDDWVRLVDLGTGEVLPLLWEVDAQLQMETHARRQAEQQARLAMEQAHLAQEQAHRAEDHARLTDERMRLAGEQIWAAEERARTAEAARQRLQVELERLRRRRPEQG